MNSNCFCQAALAYIEPLASGQGWSVVVNNFTFYGRGRHPADRIGRRKSRRVALRGVAVGLGLDIKEARLAVRFQEAVDLIALKLGEEMREALPAGRRHLSPNLIVQISRTHKDRQQYAMTQIDQGRHPFARPLGGVDPHSTHSAT